MAVFPVLCIHSVSGQLDHCGQSGWMQGQFAGSLNRGQDEQPGTARHRDGDMTEKMPLWSRTADNSRGENHQSRWKRAWSSSPHGGDH